MTTTGFKTIVIKEDEEIYNQAKIKLQYHDLTLPNFIRYCIAGISVEDSGLLEFIEKVRTKKRSARIMKKVIREQKNAKEIENMFSLNDSEIERIFDLIEENHPDL